MLVFRLTMCDGSMAEVDFEVRDERLIPVEFRGDAEVDFDYSAWEAACREFVDEVASSEGLRLSWEDVSHAAYLAWSMAMTGWWTEETGPVPEPEHERLGIRSAVSRLIWRMAQGQEVSTLEAAEIMTRSRFQTFRFLKTIEAGGFLPLFYEKETKKWRLIATRYLRI